MKWIFDIETYPNCFTFTIIREDDKYLKTFECSERKNEIQRVFDCLDYLRTNDDSMVGFNNLGFDYPVIHKVIAQREQLCSAENGVLIAMKVYTFAQEQIDSMRQTGFPATVKEDDWYVNQIDLFKIWHFDNKAKMTGLKLLEFNMRSENVSDLPFPVGSKLTFDEMDTLVTYNQHDVKETLKFFHHSKEQIAFREQLTEKYQRNFLNHNDTKIGKDYFTMRLQEAGLELYKKHNGKRVLKQSRREYIYLKNCLFKYYDFQRPEFNAILKWFSKQRITETKGVFTDIQEHELGDVAQYAEMVVKRKKFFNKPSKTTIDNFMKLHPMGWIEEEELKATEYALDENGEHILEYPLDENGEPDLLRKPKKKRISKKSYWGCWRVAETLNVVIDGFRFDFGTGGIHGSIESKVVRENKTYQIVDADVSSMYPNIAIVNRVYPEHLGEVFCDIYEDVYKQRKSFPKGSAENAMLKLALNGVYGDSNNQFSVFYDSQYTMSITINGQLSLCLLAEKLLTIEGLKLVQVNTDGVTVALKRNTREQYDAVCKQWEQQTKLQLEFAEYSRMWIRDVNNYIAEYKE